jgi:hypothetical protein
MSPYPIISIPSNARDDTEQLGSKPKFWVMLDGRRWLFKEARPGTGEDWSEKVAAEIAHVLGIDAAAVELADYEGRRGCISLSFIDREVGEALVHGNEVLALRVTGYDKARRFGQSDHTLENIRDAIRSLFASPQADQVLTGMAGYLVLDALIGNTDRHHENWGLRLRFHGGVHEMGLAPSFDHASSLGRELLDPRREELLTTDGVARYLRKARGGIFREPGKRYGENPLRLVELAARAYPEHFRPSIEQVRGLSATAIDGSLDAVPTERASPLAKQFATACLNRARELLSEIPI